MKNLTIQTKKPYYYKINYLNELKLATMGKIYIEFLNKDKNFTVDRIYFESYEKAKIWALENFEKFNPDMIKFES